MPLQDKTPITNGQQYTNDSSMDERVYSMRIPNTTTAATPQTPATIIFVAFSNPQTLAVNTTILVVYLILKHLLLVQ